MSEIIDLEKKEVKPLDPPKYLEMLITISEKGCEVKFPLMFDAMATYGMLKVAEKAIDEFYARNKASTIVKPKGGMMNFLRTKH